MAITLVTAKAAGSSVVSPPAAARASASTPAAIPPIARPTIGAQAMAAPTSAPSGASAARTGNRVSTDTDSRSARNTSGVAVADAGLVERRHVGQRRDGHLQDRKRDEGAGPFAQSQLEVDDRHEPELV